MYNISKKNSKGGENMNIDEKAHDLAMFTLKQLIESKRYKIDMEKSMPEIINEIAFEYDRIHSKCVEELKNLED